MRRSKKGRRLICKRERNYRSVSQRTLEMKFTVHVEGLALYKMIDSTNFQYEKRKGGLKTKVDLIDLIIGS